MHCSFWHKVARVHQDKSVQNVGSLTSQEKVGSDGTDLSEEAVHCHDNEEHGDKERKETTSIQCKTHKEVGNNLINEN